MPAKRLLVIDDSRDARDFLAGFLGGQGYTVLTAGDGDEGLSRALNENPDAIIADARMPQMIGLHIIEALNREGRDIPVIVVTASGSEEVAVQVFRAGACDYIVKPYEPQTILESVERALRGAWLHRERDELTEQLNRANRTLQRQLQELNAIYTIGTSVTSLLDLERVLARVVEAATFMARAEEGSLILRDTVSGELYLRATKNVDEKLARGLRIPADDSLAGRVIKTGRPVLLSGAGAKKIATTYLVKALLMVPLQTPDRGVIGVLAVANKVSDRSFGEHDVHLLTAIANYASVAIVNASLVENLQSEKSKLETILRETAEAVLIIDTNNQILLCNRAARRAFDLGGDGVLGHPVQEVIPNQVLLDLFNRPQIADSPVRTEVPLVDGNTLNACVSRISGVGYAVVMQDITHLKELDRIKSEFVSAVSHDLRTPLTTIQGYIDLLPRVGPLSEQQQEFVVRVQRSLSAINQLVNDLMDMGGIETGFDLEMSPTDLRSVVLEAAAQLRVEAQAKEQNLQTHLPPTLPSTMGNATRLRQAISNLISNAIKYTPRGGQIMVKATEGENHILINVIDNGLGIPVADQPYLFDKFFRVDLPETRAIPGTGLGLAIVKSVVESHGGRVWVESVRGQGSTFTVLLPKD